MIGLGGSHLYNSQYLRQEKFFAIEGRVRA